MSEHPTDTHAETTQALQVRRVPDTRPRRKEPEGIRSVAKVTNLLGSVLWFLSLMAALLGDLFGFAVVQYSGVVMLIVVTVVTALFLRPQAIRTRREVVHSIWSDLAGHMGGRLVVVPTKHRWSLAIEDHVELELGGYRVLVDTQVKRMGENYSELQRVRIDVAREGTVRVTPEKLADRLVKSVGAQDIRIGYADFDDAFVIKGSNSEWVRRLIATSDALRGTHLKFPESSLVFEDGQLTLTHPVPIWGLVELESFSKLAVFYALAIEHTELPTLEDARAAGQLTVSPPTGQEGALSFPE